MRILILNGPNLNLLGQREPEVYGSQNLYDLEAQCRRHGQTLGVEIDCYQNNSEGHLIDALHRARVKCQAVVFNPGGYSHTSVALRDAIAGIGIPVIEVHLTNIYSREEFRRHSITAGACVAQISGLGVAGYELALTALLKMLKPGQEKPAVPAVVPPQRRDIRDVPDEPVAAAAAIAPAAAPQSAQDKEREREEDREDKRRRRGRRGGRNRRRDQEPGREGQQRDAAREGGLEGAPAQDAPEREAEDIVARYANLKGVVVRRGLDVLAEDPEENDNQTTGGGFVKFVDEPLGADVAATEHVMNDQPLAVVPSDPAPVPVKTPAPAPAPVKAATTERAPAPVKTPAPAPPSVKTPAAQPPAEPKKKFVPTLANPRELPVAPQKAVVEPTPVEATPDVIAKAEPAQATPADEEEKATPVAGANTDDQSEVEEPVKKRGASRRKATPADAEDKRPAPRHRISRSRKKPE